MAKPNLNTRLGKRIQELRLQHDMTQLQLAEHAELGVSYLVKIEGGARQARLEVLERIAGALDEPMWKLFSDSRLTADEKRSANDAERLAEIALNLPAADVKALLLVAQRLAARK
ncbi:MAG: helix-turn-helix transcriptional regulator [Deltaproteobacteria bacterium]|nr:helix-turn-helix transcriptional regulator [Deltaproteobacteria bacterium]